MVNIICLLSIIMCTLGIIISFFDNFIFLYIGAVINVLEHILGRITGELKSLNTLILSFILACIVSLFFKTNLIDTIEIFICIESILNFVLGIVLINYRKKNMKTFEYFYIDGCIEFEALTQSWKEENKEKNIFRIKDVNDYEKLQTYTAKIVFLFNLLLDISDMYSSIRIYLNNSNEDIINTNFNEYMEILQNSIAEYNIKLNKAIDIFDKLSNIQYFRYYVDAVQNCLINYNDIYILLNDIYNKIFTARIINCNLDTYLNEDIRQLIEITDKLSLNLKQVQNVINENHNEFSHLKKIDSDRFKIQYQKEIHRY